MAFQKAVRKKAKLKIALVGPSGSGKTYSALLLAQGIGGPIAVIDTERGSASLYSHLVEFDVNELHSFEPETYIEAIKEAVKGNYSVLIIDSLSHEWEIVRDIAEKSANKNKMSGWAVATPRHQRLIDAILQAPIHVICNMRSKTEWSMEKDENGKIKPVKVGLAPVQRPSIEYEFSTVFNLSADSHLATAEKDRTEMFGNFNEVIGPAIGERFKSWLDAGEYNPEMEIAKRPKKDFVFMMLGELGLDYKNEKVRQRLEEISGKPSSNLWTETDVQKIITHLDGAMEKKFGKLRKEKKDDGIQKGTTSERKTA